MELTLCPEDAAFRDEVRGFIVDNWISSINIQFADPAYHVLRYAQLDAAA